VLQDEELDARVVVAHLAGDVRHLRGHVAELRPGKPSRRTRASCLPSRAERRRRRELRDDAELAGATIVPIRSPSLTTEPSRTEPTSPSFPSRRAEGPALDVVRIVSSGLERGEIGVELGDLALQARDAGAAVVAVRVKFVRDARRLGLEARELRLLLIGRRARPDGFDLGHGAARAEPLEPLRLAAASFAAA